MATADVEPEVGGRVLRGPVGGAAGVVTAAEEASFASVEAVEDFSAGVVSVFSTTGEEGLALAARDDFGASPRSRWSIRAAALALPRSRSRFTGDEGGAQSLDVGLESLFAGACLACIDATDLLIAFMAS